MTKDNFWTSLCAILVILPSIVALAVGLVFLFAQRPTDTRPAKAAMFNKAVQKWVTSAHPRFQQLQITGSVFPAQRKTTKDTIPDRGKDLEPYSVYLHYLATAPVSDVKGEEYDDSGRLKLTLNGSLVYWDSPLTRCSGNQRGSRCYSGRERVSKVVGAVGNDGDNWHASSANPPQFSFTRGSGRPTRVEVEVRSEDDPLMVFHRLAGGSGSLGPSSAAVEAARQRRAELGWSLSGSGLGGLLLGLLLVRRACKAPSE